MKRLEMLLPALRGEISWREVPPLTGAASTEVYIKPVDLIPVLQGYLSGERNEVEVQEWAGWVLIQEEFSVKGSEDDEIADYYEPMWHLLQQLSTPFIDGYITPEKIKHHLHTLSLL